MLQIYLLNFKFSIGASIRRIGNHGMALNMIVFIFRVQFVSKEY